MLPPTISNGQLLRTQVYDYLRDQMRLGVLKPGASINITELSEKLGVSRTPLRDALLLLQANGFVTILPQRGITINDLTCKIAELTGFKGDIVMDATKPDGQPRRCLDTSRAYEKFGFRAKMDFNEGLKRTIEWYKSIRGNSR